MSEEQDRLLREGDAFLSSQVSFDLDGPSKPVRRKAKNDATGKASKKRIEEGIVTECPGCAADIPEGEFVEAILSFVTGAADYLAGDPVRVRSVQLLQQMVSQGRLPDPHSEWSLEVVQRIERHIEHMADERARLIHRQEGGLVGHCCNGRHRFGDGFHLVVECVDAVRGIAGGGANGIHGIQGFHGFHGIHGCPWISMDIHGCPIKPGSFRT